MTNSIYKIHDVDLIIQIYNDKNELISYEYYLNQSDLVEYRIRIPNDISKVNVKYKIISMQYSLMITIDLVATLLLLLACIILTIVLIKEFSKKNYGNGFYFRNSLLSFVLILITGITLLISSRITKVDVLKKGSTHDRINWVYKGEGFVISKCKYKLINSSLKLEIYDWFYDENEDKYVKGEVLKAINIEPDEFGYFQFDIDIKDDFTDKFSVIKYKFSNCFHFYISIILLIINFMFLIHLIIYYKKHYNQIAIEGSDIFL